MTDIFGMQLETIEAIIVALGTSFVGTGTVALIVKVALNKVTKSMTEKVLFAWVTLSTLGYLALIRQ